MKKILIFIFIILSKIANASDENHPINIGCEILLDTKEDLSHISDSLRYFQKELNNNNLDVAMFLIHSFGNFKTLKKPSYNCLYMSNRILGTNHDMAVKILIKKFSIIREYEFRDIYSQFYPYKKNNKKIFNNIKNSSIFLNDDFIEELIDYYFGRLRENYKKIDNSLSNSCFFEKDIITKIDQCILSAEKNDLYASAFLGEMYLFGKEDPNKKGYFLNNSKNFQLSEKYINNTHQLMEQIIKKSDDRDDKFRNWAKDFNNNEVIKIYKKALIGDAKSQYKMGLLSISDFTPHGYNLAAELERFFGSLILENSYNLNDNLYVPNCIQAINWLEKSANQNFGPAQYILHEIYSNDYKLYEGDKNNFYKDFFKIFVNKNINEQTIGEYCVNEKNENRISNGYDFLFKAAENNEYRAQCKLGLFYAFSDDDKIRNIESGYKYILLSQKPREQNLWKDNYHIEYYDLEKKGFDQKDNEKCGVGFYKYLLPKNLYYDQDLKLGEYNQLRIVDFSNFLSGKMFNKNSSLYKRLVSEKKILSKEKLQEINN